LRIIDKKFIIDFNFNLEKIKKTKKNKIFTIINSSGIYKPYLSPIRESKKLITFGVVSKDIFVLKYLEKLDLSIFNYFFIDDKFKSKIDHKGLKRKLFEKDYFFFNPNDLTVDAALQYLNLNEFSSFRKILIIGAGNIGSKLVLSLFEQGYDITFSRRKHELGNNLRKFIKRMFADKNNILNYSNDYHKEIEGHDCIIACSNSQNIINLKDYNSFKNISKVIELGKNNFSKSLIQKLSSQNIDIHRISISNTLLNFLESSIYYINIEKKKFGRKKFKNLFIVSGGYLGLKGDIVVDNINNPKKLYGVSNGSGDFEKNINLSEIRKKLLNE